MMSVEESSQRPMRDWAAVLFAIVLPSLVTLVYFVWAESFSASIQQLAYGVGKVVQFAFPAIWVLWVQGHRPTWPQAIFRGVPLGILFGLAVAGAMFALHHYWLSQADFFAAAELEMREKIAGMQLDEPWKFALVGIFYSLLHSLLEEYYWRWFVFGQLRKLVPVGAAVVISSLGFAAHHVIVLADYFGWDALVTWVFSLGIAVGGAFWAWLYHRSGSLLGSWLGHMLVDAAIFAIGYKMVMKMVN